MTIQQALELASAHHAAGRLADAEAIYRQLIAHDSRCAAAYHFLGVIAHQCGHHQQGIELVRRSIELQPSFSGFHANFAVMLRASGRTGDAIASARRAIELDPANADAHQNLGTALEAAGRTQEAIGAFQRAVAINPALAHSWSNLGGALHECGRDAEAREACQRALAINPDLPDAHLNMGLVRLRAGEADAAEQHFARVLVLQPRHATACSGLGNIAMRRERYDEALKWYQISVEERPDLAGGWNNLGAVLTRLGRPDQAIAPLGKSVAIQPDYLDAWINLAGALREISRDDESLAAGRRALELDPTSYEACTNMGNTLGDLGHIDQAIEMYRRAVAVDPDGVAANNLLLILNSDPSADPGSIFREHAAWGERVERARVRFVQPHDNTRDPNRRLRIGYVSPDFRHHSVSYFIDPVLAYHDRGQFEMTCYADVHRPDSTSDRLRGLAERWVNIAGLSDERVAEIIRGDRIDILIDLAGHTTPRLKLFAMQAAPVQISYLGYPATTGLRSIQWRLTDDRADPPGESDTHYTERLWRLPDCFLCYAPPPGAPPVGPAARQAGRPITFAAFNNLRKVTRPALERWAAILRVVPGSRLVLKAHGFASSMLINEIRNIFGSIGIAPDRLDFLSTVATQADHLACYHRADIALDSFPYNGTTTTCEALWMGLPVITLRGQTHASRVGASILSAIGLEELIADDEAAYVRLAEQLAGDVPKLTALRTGMRQRMQSSPLMDGPAFACELEAAFRSMWRTWCDAPASDA